MGGRSGLQHLRGGRGGGGCRRGAGRWGMRRRRTRTRTRTRRAARSGGGGIHALPFEPNVKGVGEPGAERDLLDDGGSDDSIIFIYFGHINIVITQKRDGYELKRKNLNKGKKPKLIGGVFF